MEEEEIVMDEADFGGTPTEEVETSETPVVTEEATPASTEVTDEQILNALNARGIKYNGETVKVENLEDFIGTYQKGLNYDKVKAKVADDEVMNYLNQKANSMGITPREYIQRVKQYEEEQKKNQINETVQRLINNGIDEQTAREVAETKSYMEQLKAEKEELRKEKESALAEKKKDAEYEEFLKKFPDVKASDIPQEVFERAKEVGLPNAYAEYENKALKEKIKQLEQNIKNASNSVVTSTTDGGSTQQESKDAFLEGFDSV